MITFKYIAICFAVLFIAIYIYLAIRKAKYGKESIKLKNISLQYSKSFNANNQAVSVRFDTKSFIYDLLELAIPILIVYLVMTQVIGVGIIQSGSMEPTLKVGNIAIYDRLCYSYKNESVDRGNIIWFYLPEEDKYLSKRVIALPGETILIDQGKVFIDGNEYNETEYINGLASSVNYHGLFTIPEQCYFVMGDNRENSLDSRYWKTPYVEMSQIKGRFLFQLRFSLLKSLLSPSD